MWIASSSSAWTSLGLDVGAQAGAQVDGGGLAQRHDRGAEDDVVRDHDRVLALGERRVEQAERGDDALDLAGEAAGLQAHAVADLERPHGDQHEAGDQVAERLLGGETDDDRGDGAADGQRARVQPGDRSATIAATTRNASRIRKPTVPAVAGVHAAEQRGRREAPEVARERPAERDHHDRGGDADRRVDAEDLLALDVRDDRARPAAGRSAAAPTSRGGRAGRSAA